MTKDISTVFRKLLIVLSIALPLQALAKTPDQTSKTEIEHLISFVKDSGCDFNRNGSWHKSADAADHINTKYQYVLDKGLVGNTEDFIDYAATKSSMSGKKYTVRCNGNEPIESAGWLKTELSQFRQKK